MVVKCDIEFEKNTSGTFYAGQEVRGTITLKLDKPKDVKAITLKISGYAQTLWWEEEFGKSEEYSAHEDYISQLDYLLKPEKASKLTLETGLHCYNFGFKLPENCPPSLQTANAKICYSLKVSIVRPWKFNQNFTKGFTVLNILDLNLEGDWIRDSFTAELEKNFGFASNKTEPLHMQATIAPRGFVPGQSIPINLIVDNASQVEVEAIKISLLMMVLCHNDGVITEMTTNRVLVAKLKGEGVLRHCKKVFNYMLDIPATPPTCLNACRYIKIGYEIYFEAAVKGWHASPVLVLPVTIGNVPLKADVEKLKALSCLPQLEGAQCSASNPQYDAPPTYEEATHIPSDSLKPSEEPDYGEKEFAPRYPVFNLKDTQK